MSEIEYWFKALAKLKEEQRKREEELLKVEGLMEGIEKVSTHPLDRTVAPLFKMVIKLERNNQADHIFFFETFLTLLSNMARDIDTLKGVALSLASGNEALEREIENVKKSLEERERMLKELEDIVEERRNFYEEHR
jgi:hypothetical protein